MKVLILLVIFLICQTYQDMAEANSDLKETVQEKLISIFDKDAETLTRILFYLDEEDKAYEDRGDSIPPVWNTLKLTLSKDNMFKMYAERLAEDTKKAEKDEAFRKTMNLLYTQMIEPLEEPSPNDIGQHLDVNRIADFGVAQKSAFIGLYRAWNMMPRTTQVSIMEAIPKIIKKELITYVDDVAGMVQKVGDSIVTVGLAALYLSYDAIVNLRRWWNGEISGKRCAKNIVDSFVTLTAGMAGGAGGAVIGSLFGPVGTVIGGIFGGIASSATMNAVSDRVTQSLFSIPKSEALENAYRYLDVPMSASNNEINSAFHKLCLKHHPDKRGSTEEFFILQLHMATIKAAKGEL